MHALTIRHELRMYLYLSSQGKESICQFGLWGGGGGKFATNAVAFGVNTANFINKLSGV